MTDDAKNVSDANAIAARIAIGEGTMPAKVLASILDEDLNPVAAWRKYRGLSQADLAKRAGLSQVWISRIEAGGGHGTPATRRKWRRRWMLRFGRWRVRTTIELVECHRNWDAPI